MKNPIIPNTYTLTYISYYNSSEISSGTDYAKIDQEQLIQYTYQGVTPFDDFEMTPFQIWTKDACGDNERRGVFRFKVRFSETLTYDDDNHLILTNFDWNPYTWNSNHNEYLCYFDLDTNFHSVKSELCEY